MKNRYLWCPRCRAKLLKPEKHLNPLSRLHPNVPICPDCAMDEALALAGVLPKSKVHEDFSKDISISSKSK